MTIDESLKGEWLVAARSRDVVEGKIFATRIHGHDVILWRSSEGAHCWLDLCVHRGARLSIGSVCNDRVKCAYHGWTYDSGGRCVEIPAHPDLTPPARARTTVFPVFEKYGLIWMSFEPATPEPVLIPDIGAEGFDTWANGPFEAVACGPRMVENFLDVAHLPIVHAGSLGTLDRAEIGDYEVVDTADGPFARDIRIYQPNPDGMGSEAEVSYDYGVLRPLTVYLKKFFGDKVSEIMLWVTPVDGERSRAYFLSCANYERNVSEDLRESFARLIIGQDIPVVESQRPELLPLDLQAELHLRSDRLAIAYRMWLRKQNFSFGTS
jgi:phenylpropionate dioxygenase-like ring-hydroxylating dioxygenase large terminal subunit